MTDPLTDAEKLLACCRVLDPKQDWRDAGDGYIWNAQTGVEEKIDLDTIARLLEKMTAEQQFKYDRRFSYGWPSFAMLTAPSIHLDAIWRAVCEGQEGE